MDAVLQVQSVHVATAVTFTTLIWWHLGRYFIEISVAVAVDSNLIGCFVCLLNERLLGDSQHLGSFIRALIAICMLLQESMVAAPQYLTKSRARLALSSE